MLRSAACRLLSAVQGPPMEDRRRRAGDDLRQPPTSRRGERRIVKKHEIRADGRRDLIQQGTGAGIRENV
jgi:hypothetical protein